MSLADVASGRWDGTGTTPRIGNTGLANVGDVNGDGRDDVAFSDRGATTATRGIIVAFTPGAATGQPNQDSPEAVSVAMPPSRGYRIVPGTTTSPQVKSIGDQNGDGVPDMLVAGSGNFLYVVYGVSDPSSLPQCNGVDPLRCLDLATLAPAQGYELMSTALGGGVKDAFGSAGDFNGDGIDDIVTSSSYDSRIAVNAGSATVVFGGRSAPVDGSPVDIDALPASEAIRFTGTVELQGVGNNVNGVGDQNGDGRDDLGIFVGSNDLEYAARLQIVFGGSVTTSPMPVADLTPAQSYALATPPIAGIANLTNGGDANGDGLDDLLFGGIGITSLDGFATVAYGTATPQDALIPTAPIDPARGYNISPNEAGAALASDGQNQRVDSAGDLNGDGLSDQMIGAPGQIANGLAGAGAGYLLFAQRPPIENPLLLGPTLTGDHGIALVGNAAGDGAGSRLAHAGDLDQDGLPDYFVAAPTAAANGVASTGSVYVVLGKTLIGTATTGLADADSPSTATLGGTARTNGRDSTAWFEYGTSEEYGSRSGEVDLGSGGGNQFVEAALSRLQPETTYHYQLVVENDLGVQAVGGDRTFTTPKAPTPEPPPEDCSTNPNLPGCAKAQGPRLGALIVSPKVTNVKRNTRGMIRAYVTNTGDEMALDVKVCVKVPKKFIKVQGKNCKSRGSLAPGTTKLTKIKVKVKGKAKKNKKFTLRLTATSSNVRGSKKSNVKVRAK